MKKVPFSQVLCDGNEQEYLGEVLRSGWLTTAGKTLEFEKRFAAFVSAPYACAVNSCTAALHLALDAVGVGPGDRVFVPTMTFTATAEVVRYVGADPVFLDVEYGTNLLTPEIVREAIQRHPNVSTLMLVHYAGQPAQLTTENKQGILDLCAKHQVVVIQDAAHAFPARWAGHMIGHQGDITCFSFYANKTITTGEGGMLVTHDESLHRRVKTMRLHGIDRDVWNRFTSDRPAWEYDVVAPGFKYNMPDLAAAIGLAQLERAEEFRAERERCARYYLQALAGLSDLDLPKLQVPFHDHAWHLFPITLRSSARISRNRFIELLAARGIGTSVHYKPLHRMTYYRDRYALQPEDYPQAEKSWQGSVSLPIYPSLKEEDLAYVCQTVRELLASAQQEERRRGA